jgi:hypothetical protein
MRQYRTAYALSFLVQSHTHTDDCYTFVIQVVRLDPTWAIALALPPLLARESGPTQAGVTPGYAELPFRHGHIIGTLGIQSHFQHGLGPALESQI